MTCDFQEQMKLIDHQTDLSKNPDAGGIHLPHGNTRPGNGRIGTRSNSIGSTPNARGRTEDGRGSFVTRSERVQTKRIHGVDRLVSPFRCATRDLENKLRGWWGRIWGEFG